MTARFASSGSMKDPEFALYTGPGSPPSFLMIVDGVATKTSDRLSLSRVEELRTQLEAQGELQSFSQPRIPGAGVAVEAVIVGQSPDGGAALVHVLVAQHGERTFTMTFFQMGASTSPPDWHALVAGVRLSTDAFPWKWVGLGAVGVFLLLGTMAWRRGRQSPSALAGRIERFGRTSPMGPERARPSWAPPLTTGEGPTRDRPSHVPTGVPGAASVAPAARPMFSEPLPGLRSTLRPAPDGMALPPRAAAVVPPQPTPPAQRPAGDKVLPGLRSTLPASGVYGGP